MSILDENLLNFKDVELIHNAVYNIPGIFLCSKLIYLLMDIIEEKFNYKLPIRFIYGSPILKWNSGRLIINDYNNEFSLNNIEKELLMAKSRGITPLLTFSNTIIEKDDLFDKKSNDVLKIISEIDGGIIVTSELLYNYIKEKFPDISIHASVIKTSCKKNRNKEYYSLLSNKFDYFVIHPDDNFDYLLLESLPKRNAEVLINERCYYGCKFRKAHYDSISIEQISQSNKCYRNTHFLNNCNAIPEEKQLFSKKRNISLTISEIRKLHNLGYGLFKIQGRTDNLNLFFFDLMRYMLENEFVFPHVYAIFLGYIDKFIKGEL